MKNRKKLRFIHVTKCAGTSIEGVGSDWGRFDKDMRAAYGRTCPPNWEWWHVPPKYLGHDELTSLCEGHDFFTVVRSPYDRVISEYYCKWGGPQTKAESVEAFNSWISDKLEELLELLRMGERVHGHWCPQYLYVEHVDGTALLPSENILRLETLGVSFDALMARYADSYSGLSLNNFERANVSAFAKKFNKEHLSKRNKRLIERLYARDFELFGYDLEMNMSPVVAATVTAGVTATSVTVSDSSRSISEGHDHGSSRPGRKTTKKAEVVVAAGPAGARVKKLSLQEMLRLRKARSRL